MKQFPSMPPFLPTTAFSPDTTSGGHVVPSSSLGEDILAGSFLIFYALLGLGLTGLVFTAMQLQAKEMKGFHFLASQAVADMILFTLYGLIAGVIILARSGAVPKSPASRNWLHVFMDVAWFSMALHYSVVGIFNVLECRRSGSGQCLCFWKELLQANHCSPNTGSKSI